LWDPQRLSVGDPIMHF